MVIVSWVLGILRGIASVICSASSAVVALPERRLEGPSSSDISASDGVLSGVSGSEPSRRRVCIFATGDRSLAGALGIVESLVYICGRFAGCLLMLTVLWWCVP